MWSRKVLASTVKEAYFERCRDTDGQEGSQVVRAKHAWSHTSGWHSQLDVRVRAGEALVGLSICLHR